MHFLDLYQQLRIAELSIFSILLISIHMPLIVSRAFQGTTGASVTSTETSP